MALSLLAFFLSLGTSFAVPPPAPGATEWQAFVRRYLGPEGRVIDTANRGISHSEGQGYGMLFAVHFDDRPRFDLIWQWTHRHLSRASDHLHAWRFEPHAGIGVSDSNNATDGDIFIAWALLMASERWQSPEYGAAARGIATDILRCCVKEVNGRTVMLPGALGFQDASGTTINLSYYAFPALRALSRAVPDPRWSRLEHDGLALVEQSAFGRWRLPPDWLLLPAHGGPPTPATHWPERFSWDALRVPLNLAWQGHAVPMLHSAHAYWSASAHPRRPPAWVDLRSGEIAPYPGHAGIRAVHALLLTRRGEDAGRPIAVAEAPDYFAAALVLQSRIAPHMPAEAPALAPEVATADAPSQFSQLTEATEAAWQWFRHFHGQTQDQAAPGQLARADRHLPAQVRGVPPGLHGLAPPR
ncbi:glycosyl hydrolase family 8 [Sediminicoccus sp. KRV36]|uniref:glycosyl hydrolase family 8 n=1 Tax=Sediminicoccus sp. KRV36 TaxID=3133721 RepID=UPI00200F37C3|nr:glycosyl hydrolase family 8 [Sediminicoccus rosea]UPY37011.1 glycosyl hydrolase family 5 [Sediminicoccus rosea]